MTIQSKSDKLHFTFTISFQVLKRNGGETRQKQQWKLLHFHFPFYANVQRKMFCWFQRIVQCRRDSRIIILQTLHTCQMMPRNLHFTIQLIQSNHANNAEYCPIKQIIWHKTFIVSCPVDPLTISDIPSVLPSIA